MIFWKEKKNIVKMMGLMQSILRKEDTVTVGYLIERGYLDTVVNPITKEIISNDSYVDYRANEFIIVN